MKKWSKEKKEKKEKACSSTENIFDWERRNKSLLPNNRNKLIFSLFWISRLSELKNLHVGPWNRIENFRKYIESRSSFLFWNVRQRLQKLLFNALVKPIFEYCCSVWGNAPNDQLLRILRVQKRWGRLILDARLLDNSAQMFQKLQWGPIDNIMRIKNMSMMFKIVNKECPDYFKSYRTYKKYP